MINKSIEDVREFLAELMELGYKDGDLIDDEELINFGNYKTIQHNWKPNQNLEQAIEVLEEYQPLHIDITSSEDQNKWICMIGLSDYESNSKINAIIGAILTKENKTELLEVLEDNQ